MLKKVLSVALSCLLISITASVVYARIPEKGKKGTFDASYNAAPTERVGELLR